MNDELSRGARFGVLLFLLGHPIASLVAPSAVWGVSHLRYCPPRVVALWCLGLLLVLTRVGRHLCLVGALSLKRFVPRSRPLLVACCSSFLLFLLLHSEHCFWGDGYTALGEVETPKAPALRAGTGALTVYWLVFQGLRVLYGQLAPATVFAILGALAGALVTLVAWRLSDLLAPHARPLVFGILVLSGGSALFFGHVEEYPLLHAAILVFIYLSLRSIRGRRRFVGSTIALVAACTMHLSALALLPAWLFLLGHTERRTRITLGIVLLAVVASLLPLGAPLLRLYGGASALARVAETRGNGYAMLSWPYGLFLFNQLLLVLGASPLLLLARSANTETEPRRPTGGSGQPRWGTESAFLLIALAGTATFVALLDPKFGPRDWDLLALPMFPALACVAFWGVAKRGTLSPHAGVLIVGAMVLHTAPWIVANKAPGPASAMIHSMVRNDPHYVAPGAIGYRFLGDVLQGSEENAAAENAFRLAARYGGQYLDFRNLSDELASTGRYSESLEWLDRAIAADPDAAEPRISRARVLQKLGRWQESESELRDLVMRQPNNGVAFALLGASLLHQGKTADAAEALEESARMGSLPRWALPLSKSTR